MIGLAQNLVPNPSFEETDCDAETDEYFFPALDWYNVTNSSPDYYSISLEPGECFASSPTGGQIPRTGTFMAGLWGSKTNSPTRDYIQSKLNTPLEEDSIYCIEMYILLGEFCPLAINRYGVQLSTDSLYDYSTFQLLTGGTLLSSSVDVFLSDAENWMQLNWEYQATGGEEFVTLGNFWSEAELEYIEVEGSDSFQFAYYFVDDVSIVKCGATNLVEEDIVTIIGPNPVVDLLTVFVGNRQADWEIFTVDGRSVGRGNISGKQSIEMGHLASAMYLIRITDNRGRMQSRLICKQ